jgi:LuxR family maltose regulon positive regulatory protein
MLEEATALLNSWTAELDNHEDERLQALVLRVAVQEENGNHDSALATLESALTLAEPGGFIRLFVDGGSTIQQLVRQIHSLGKLPDYTSRIVAAFSDAGTGTVGKAITARSAGTNTARDSRELLSGREHEVLLEIALGLSNQDIAEKLFISLLTVKVHVRNIFAKLETASRTAAVAKARSLGILP